MNPQLFKGASDGRVARACFATLERVCPRSHEYEPASTSRLAHARSGRSLISSLTYSVIAPSAPSSASTVRSPPRPFRRGISAFSPPSLPSCLNVFDHAATDLAPVPLRSYAVSIGGQD